MKEEQEECEEEEEEEEEDAERRGEEGEERGEKREDFRVRVNPASYRSKRERDRHAAARHIRRS